jgi:hypothetical protein
MQKIISAGIQDRQATISGQRDDNQTAGGKIRDFTIKIPE